jgi:hypothetical protein
LKIYIACALTHVPRNHFDEYVAFQHRLAATLADAEGHSVKYALVNSDPQLAAKPVADRAKLCYLWDSKMIQEADVVIAECSFPSIGLGVELQIAATEETPVIVAFRDFRDNRASPVHYRNPDSSNHELQIGDGFVSLMALGIPTVFKVHRYESTDDGIQQIVESVRLLRQ